jgi:hypothetical protein
MKIKITSLFLFIIIIIIPLVVVQVIPTDTPEPYLCKVKIKEDFGNSGGGKLMYYLVQNIEGASPPEFVAALDTSYTRGLSHVSPTAGKELWIQGSLMTHDVFYGDQYLFFDYPEIYVRQIKERGLWPDQITELRIMYAAPVMNLSAIATVWIFPFIEEFRPTTFTILIAQAAVVVAATVLLVKRRKKKGHVALVILSYVVIMILLTIPLLTDLY